MKKFLNIFNNDKRTLEERVLEIQSGDVRDREDLIEEYVPFVIKSISQITNRYIETENDEEYSIGLRAFNEAIDRYEQKRGSFISFARLIIKSRLIDNGRKRKLDTVAIESESEDDNIIDNIARVDDFTNAIEAREEIAGFEKKLLEFGVSLQDLVEQSPKHLDARLRAIEIARFIVENEDLKNDFYRKKTIPANRISAHMKISTRTLKRNRKFIIAAAIALDGDEGIIRNYVVLVEGGVNIGIQGESAQG